MAANLHDTGPKEPRDKKGPKEPEIEKVPDPEAAKDAFPPILKQQWTTAPNLPDKKVDKPKGGKDKPEPPVAHPAWIVSPGSLRDCETGLITEVSTQITDYMALREEVERVKGTIFRPREPPDWVKIQYEDGAYEWGQVKRDFPAQLNNLFGASPEQSEKYGDMLENALVSAANVIYLVGELTQMLNDAAQGYVIADINARMPEKPNL